MRVRKSFFRTALALLVTAASSLMPFSVSASSASSATVIHSLSAGANTTCALRASNAIYCVGDNSFGQLGDGTTVDSSEPVRVQGLSSALSLSVGKSVACAIGTDEYGYCWGSNSVGQQGSSGLSSVARKISLDKPLLDIQVGENYACALTTTNQVYCWGSLGDGSPGAFNNPTPTLISNTLNVSSLAVGSSGVCLISSNVYCFGKTPFAQSLTLIPDTQGATSVAVGLDFACVLVTGLAKCWGDNSQGQLGNGTTTALSGIVDVTGITDAKSITVGDQFACVLNILGGSFCWGDNSSNQISVTGQDLATRVPSSFTNSADLDAGAKYLCSLQLSGEIKCVGDNSKAQSAILLSSVTPIGPLGLTGVAKISTGVNTTCAIDASGNLSCWGSLVPETVTGALYTDVAVGAVSACAITVNGDVQCWGANGSGQLGDGSSRSALVPVQVSGLGSNKAAHIAAGYRHFCISTRDGLVYCWGDNSHQQLGNAGLDSKTAIAVAGIGTATSISAGLYHSCALVTGGQSFCWGDNSKKQINSSSTTRLGVTSVTQAANVSKISSGAYENCFLMVDGKVNCIGENTDLQAPGLLAGTFTDVSAGTNSVCVVKTTSNQVACFGSNTNSKLGRTGLKSATPSDVPGLLATSIAVGDESACAITSTSTLRCWGSNSSGQLASSFGFPQAFANITVTLSGRANVGETIFAATSSNEPYSVSSYTWFKSSDGKNAGTQITDATAISYVPAVTELGKYFSVGVVLTKWGCTSTTFKSAMFGPTLAAIRILQSSVPTITGKFKSGQLLFARAGTWDSGVVFTYQWYRGTAKITGAKSAIYKLGAADVGKQISVWVTGSKPGLPKVVKKSVKSSKVTR